MKVATIVGARPQFIKAAIVSRAFGESRRLVREVLIHTGQHYDANMSRVFFEELDIPEPACNLGVGGGTHGQNTGQMLEKIEEVLLTEHPDWVLVYGDTDSTLAGALAAAKLHIPVAHVEAGLRSFNRRMPEEINRLLTDHAGDLLFTPTDTASRNLANEGIPSERVRQVGDVMYDAALFYAERAEARSRILETLDLAPKKYVLATVHRAENTDDRGRLAAILEGFAASASSVVWPMHPRTRERIQQHALKIPGNIRVIKPVGYLDMVMLERHATVIATDSGGVQKEAFFLDVPCVVLRDETEWVELVEAGAASLVGPASGQISAALVDAKDGVVTTNKFFGIGDAGMRIAESLS